MKIVDHTPRLRLVRRQLADGRAGRELSRRVQVTIRILGKLTCTTISFLYTWHMHIKVSKTFVVKCAKIRHFLQLTASFSLAFSLFTFTGDGFPKTRMPIGDIGSQIACAFANRAGIYCCMLLYHVVLIERSNLLGDALLEILSLHWKSYANLA